MLLETLMPEVLGMGTGMVAKLLSLKMQDEREKHNMFLQTIQAQNNTIMQRNEQAKEDKGFAWTRRFIAIAVTTVMVGAFFSSEVNVPIETTEGVELLWGLWDNTKTVVDYVSLTGGTVLPEMITSFRVIVSAYFGAGLLNRK